VGKTGVVLPRNIGVVIGQHRNNLQPIVIEHHDVEQVAVPVAVPVFFPTGRRLRAHTFNAQTQQITSGAPIVPTGAPIVPTGAPILLMGTPRLCTAMDCR